MLSKLEELILLAVFRGGADATAGDVQSALSAAFKREQQFGSVFTSLDRLSEKKMVRWKKGEPDARRGGRAPRLYEITALGQKSLDASLRATQIIGGVVVSPNASELIFPLTMAVQRSLTVADLAATIGVYPSLSGSIAEAARRLMLHDDLD